MLGMAMRSYITGDESAVYREENDDYTIRIQYREKDRNSLDAVEQVTIPTAKGFVPVKALTQVRYEGGAASVDRKNRQRKVTVMANVAEGSSGALAGELGKKIQNISLKPGYQIKFAGMQEMMAESFGELFFAMFLAVILTYMVLTGILESLVMPIVIMLTQPMGLIGVIWARFITGNTLSMMSLMSIIMLIGIVVNNAILIIDYAKQEMAQGMALRPAIITAAGAKFKAILMMNLAIVLAMLPQALGFGSGAEIRAPFSITAIGGILVSTVLTLFVIPGLYMAVERKK
jgi:HAE1 family hydrophobic/amphiphilic exporter-1